MGEEKAGDGYTEDGYGQKARDKDLRMVVKFSKPQSHHQQHTENEHASHLSANHENDM